MRALLILALMAFVVIPAVEIATFIQVGGRIGALPTIMLTIFTAVLGVALVRMQGIIALADIERAMARGRAPFVEMLSGALLLLAGILLLIPGFVTDGIGFALLVPPLRRAVAAGLARLLMRPPKGPGGVEHRTRVIEVEVVDVRDTSPPDAPRRLPRE